MSFASRLKEQRERMGYTQATLAAALGVTKGAVGNYETGLNSPKAETLFKVFEVLKCDANYLFQDEMSSLHEDTASPEEMSSLVRKFRQLDPIAQKLVLSVINIELERATPTVPAMNVIHLTPRIPFDISEQPASAGTGTYLGPDGFHEIMVDPTLVAGADFGVPVRGNSMEPKFHDGDIILISMSQPVEIGDIALVTMDGYGYVKTIGENQLVSLNKEYAPIPMTEDIRINGKVIGVLTGDIANQQQ